MRSRVRKAEGVRLAYVAATRARDLLVVPAIGDDPWEGGWLGPLNRALYPPTGQRRAAAVAPGCPVFKSKDSVLERPNDDAAGPGTVCPGLHTFGVEGYSVAWWDPGPGGGLTLGAKPPFGVRRDDLIVKDVPRQTIAAGRSTYDRWRLSRADARGRGAQPSILLETARTWTADPERPLPAAAARCRVTIVDLLLEPSGQDRPGGAAFGVLVHALLARVPFDADDDVLPALAAVEARVLGLGDAAAAAAARSVTRVVRHELFARARDSWRRGVCRRETPVTVTLPDGTLVEGVVDLAFEEQGAWTVVEYKTDREIAAAGEERCRRQVALYAAAIAQASGAASSGVLVRM